MALASSWMPLFAAAPPVQFDLPGTDGARHASAELAVARVVVLVFIAVDCPISNRYSPLLHQLESEYQGKGVRFLAVFSDPAVAGEAAAAHLREFGLRMPGLLDRSLTLARQTGARTTPEAVVLSPGGAILYKGRIDDRYVDFGKTRAVVREQDLRQALDEILAGRAVTHPVTKALGCAIAQ